MIALAVKVVGLQSWIRGLKSTLGFGPKSFRGTAEQKLKRAALIVIGSAQKQFEGERTRARYLIVGGRRVRNQTPRPVTSPPDKLGVFEGRYRSSFGFDKVGSGKNQGLVVGPTVKYAPLHEFGKMGMPKRQVLTPAVDQTEEEVYRLIGTTFEVLE